MNYQESISRLEEASVFGIKPGLERMQKILAVLGNPEKACKMIHITGDEWKRERRRYDNKCFGKYKS